MLSSVLYYILAGKTNFPSQIQNEIEEDKQEKFQKKIEMAFVEMINGIILMNCLKWSVKPVIQALHIAKSSNQEFVILLDLKSLIDDTVDKHCCIISKCKNYDCGLLIIFLLPINTIKIKLKTLKE